MATVNEAEYFVQLPSALRQVDYFQLLSDEELQTLASSGQVMRQPRNAVIFVEDDPGAGLFVLLQGRVQICKLSREGQIAILAVFDPVMMFNEVSALDGGPNPATAIATEESLLWRLPSERLDGLILRYPAIGLGLLKVLAGRNRRLVHHFEDLSFRSVLARAAKLLLELSQSGARAIDRREHTNHQMAAQIATVPEAFSRCLKVFKTAGDIESSHSHLLVQNPEHLSKIAQTGPKSQTNAQPKAT